MTNLDYWRTFLEDCESPDIFIDFTFYSTISAALQRNVCWKYLPHRAPSGSLFPNTYVVFIAPPGIGKSFSARWSKEVFKSFGGFEKLDEQHKRIINIAPSSITLEALYRRLHNYPMVRKLDPSLVVNGDPNPYICSPLAFFCVEELGTLMREHTTDLVTFLQEGYDCGDFHNETKTAGVDFVRNMCTTLLGCATPDWVREVTKNGLLKQGFAARTIFVYGDTKRKLKFDFEITDARKAALKRVSEHVFKLTKLYGAAVPTPEAMEWSKAWYEQGGEKQKNRDPRLADYYARKRVHLIRMAMLHHFADKLDFEITVDDFKAALATLSRAEVDMHRALLGSGKNVACDVANAILGSLERRRQTLGPDNAWVPAKQLLADYFHECTSREDFDAALLYAVETGKAETSTIDGRICYRFVENEETK